MKKYDVVATIGHYMAGNEKKWINRNVGSVVETQHGLAITLDACFNPAGCQVTEDGRVWLKLFEPRDKNAAQQAYQSANAPMSSQNPAQNKSAFQNKTTQDDGNFEDDIPW